MTSFSMACLALLSGFAQASGPSLRQEFDAAVAQVQKSPADAALREKAIALAQKLKPAPAAPEEMERRLARGEAAFETAKSPEGFAAAVKEFEAASLAAPWAPMPYYNLGIAQEKSGDPSKAMESLRFYLLAAPDAKDAAEVKKRRFKLEYAAEQHARAAADDSREKRITGLWHKSARGGDGRTVESTLKIAHETGSGFIFTSNSGGAEYKWSGIRESRLEGGDLLFIADELILPDNKLCGTYAVRGIVSADGRELALHYTLQPFAANRQLSCPLPKYYGDHTDTWTR